MPNLEEVVWCQEEPRNNGAWFFVDSLIEEAAKEAEVKAPRPRYAGRNASASPAPGIAKLHTAEHAAPVAAVLHLSVRDDLQRKQKEIGREAWRGKRGKYG